MKEIIDNLFYTNNGIVKDIEKKVSFSFYTNTLWVLSGHDSTIV